MSKSYIFCQAPSKIPATLICYENEKALNNDVIIIAKNTISIKLFLDSLNLKAAVEYLEPIKIKGYLLNNVSYIKRKVKKDINRLGILEKKDNQVFFTDIFDDFTMGIYLSELKGITIKKIQGHIDIVDNFEMKYAARKNLPIKLRIKELLYSYIFKYKFLYTLGDHWTWTIDLRKLHYPTLDYSDMKICKKYMKQSSEDEKHKILFFTEPYRNTFQTEQNYNELNHDIITILQQKGYKVEVKGHPRLGLPKGIKEIANFEIPSFIPAEFINIKSYDFVIGFVSTSIVCYANIIDAYSVLPMCKIIDEQQANYWYDYLKTRSDNKIFFLNSFNQIPPIK